jgi:hypothetical protein
VAKGLALSAQFTLHLEHGSINSLLKDANLHTLNTDHTLVAVLKTVVVQQDAGVF